MKQPFIRSVINWVTSLKKPWQWLLILGIAVILVGTVWMALSSEKSPDSLQKSSSIAVVDKCETNETVTFACYKTQLSDIVKNQNPQPAFDLVKQQYTKEPLIKSLCHQLVHVIGRTAYAKYDNLADTFAHGDQFCWSGYYHGVMEQLADEKGANYIADNANTICAGIAAKQRQSFYHFNCVHGLGHGFMEVLDANLFDSLKACDNLTDDWERTSCYGGVFMQNIMNVQSPDNTTDHTSKYLRPSEPMYPCTAVEDKYKEQCYLMQTSYALQIVNYDFSKIFTACSLVETTYRTTCYQSLGRDASGQSISDSAKTKSTCLLGPTQEAQSNCIIGAAKDFVSYFHSDTQANQLCDSLGPDLKQVCAATVKSYYAAF